MAFDLDDEENEATRKMNGASKERKEENMDIEVGEYVRTKELIPKYIIELKLEELIKNQELTEQGIYNREDIEEKEERGAIKILKEILKEVEKVEG